MSQPVFPQPVFPRGVCIGLDWGTSTARAFVFDDNGQVIAQSAPAVEAGLGVQSLHASLGRSPEASDFARALQTLLDSASSAGTPASALLQRLQEEVSGRLAGKDADTVPIIACGMIGSKQGLTDAGYLPCPIAPSELAGQLVPVVCSPFKLLLVPGLKMPSLATGNGQTRQMPDVMRGEETQILGALAASEASTGSEIAEDRRNENGRDKAGKRLMVLPGSHSKWASIRDGRIERFETHFSGELFAALSQHTILGRLFETSSGAPGIADQAFQDGLSLARESPARLQNHLFSVRALGLNGELASEAGASFLSGLLIGHELCAALSGFDPALTVDIVGSDALCERYAQALKDFGRNSRILGNTSATGLWQLAQVMPNREITT